jgi:LmbE family N-acetylglucosaminyl deacetylase
MIQTDRPRGVVLIGAHPDDETIMAGGTLAMLHAEGIPTFVVCVTDGRGGESGEVTEAGTPDSLAVVRKGELECAAQALGVDGVWTLDYQDPVIGPNEELYGFDADQDALVRRLGDILRERGADVVLTHGSDGEYGHPAHVQVHRAALRMVRQQGMDVVLYSFAARVPGIEDHIWNESDPAHWALAIDPWAEAKIAAMECHRTQHVLFKRRRQLQAVRQALRTVEGFHRHWPPTMNGRDPFAAVLERAGAWRPEHDAPPAPDG